MATGTIILPIPPHGADPTNPPGMLYENFQWVLTFDSATDEIVYWTFRLPANYGSSPVAKLRYKMDTATSGNIVMQMAIRATADGEDPASSGFDTENGSGQVAVPGTAELEDEVSITLTNNDSMAAGESITVRLRRDADSTSATDDATGDLKLIAASIEYTTA